jgi:hypothetical protein
MDSNTHSTSHQLTVTVDLDSLLGGCGGLGGEVGGVGPLGSEGCRRLACDGALTRVLVTRQPSGDPGRKHGPHGRKHGPHGRNDGLHGHDDGPHGDEAAMSGKGRECRCGPESENGQPTPTTALATLAIALPQLLELAAVLRLAGLLFDLLDKLLAPWASRKILDELAD